MSEFLKIKDQRQRDAMRETTRELNTLKSEMHEIKSLLKQLVKEK